MVIDVEYELKQILRRAHQRGVGVNISGQPGGVLFTGGERFQRAALADRLNRLHTAALAERKTVVIIDTGSLSPRLAVLSTPLPELKVASGLRAGVRLDGWYETVPEGNCTPAAFPVLRQTPGATGSAK